MSVGAVLTLGYGSFGGINLVTTLGYGETSVQPAPDDQPSNWQANYWVHSKRRTKEDDDEERRRLGILPPLEESAAREVVAEAVKAQAEIARETDRDGENLLAILEARREFGEIYRRAFAEAYAEELIALEWERRMNAERARRAAILLLLN